MRKHPRIYSFGDISDLYCRSLKQPSGRFTIGELVHYCAYSANGKMQCIVNARIVGSAEENREKGTVYVLDLAFETNDSNIYTVHENVEVAVIDDPAAYGLSGSFVHLIDAADAQQMYQRLKLDAKKKALAHS